jgi:hypothetical protein
VSEVHGGTVTHDDALAAATCASPRSTFENIQMKYLQVFSNKNIYNILLKHPEETFATYV